MTARTKWLLAGFLLLVIVAAGAAVWYSKLRQVTVTLQASPGVTISFGEVGNETIGKILATASGNTRDIKVAKGFYAVQFSQANHTDLLTYVTVQSNKVVTAPQLSYSPAYLQQQQTDQKSAIEQAIAGVLPPSYSVGSLRLVDDGTWSVAFLTSANSNKDPLRTIAHQQPDGSWTVVAQPNIVLAKADYPNIPANVVEAADSPF